MKAKKIKYEINRIDMEIITLIARRSNLTSGSGLAQKDNADVTGKENTEEVIRRVMHKAVKTGLDPHIAEKVYRVIESPKSVPENTHFNKEERYFPDI